MNINKLNKLIESSKLNKSQLASQCGISPQTLYSILSGADMRVSTLETLLSALGVSMPAVYDDATSNIATATGRNSIAAVNSAVNDSKAMEEKIRLLEQILKEKERTIQILLKDNDR